MPEHRISPQRLDIETIARILQDGYSIALSETSQENIRRCRAYLDDSFKADQRAVYGINTGFGSLCKVRIDDADIEKLQLNLLRSHACGTGPAVPPVITKLMLLLKIQSLQYGYSGVGIDTVWRLMDFYNHDVLPLVYEQGSLGASGDLCPLAHLSLPLIGEGELRFRDAVQPSGTVHDAMHWKPLQLHSKEGLALLNGTQFMSAYAVYCLIRAQHIALHADRIAALSLDAWLCRPEPFDARIHAIRGQEGQQEVAKNILELLEGSEMFFTEKEQVQDPYSFRCIPQVHGACRDAINYCKRITENEINGVSDNPNIFAGDDVILSGGNFHGEPLALAMDFLAIALSELGNIAERRIYRMLSGARDLPEFLAASPGLHSGMMIPQYVAASLVSQNKQLCTPASVDSIASCNEQEDHVSMGANAATKCLRVVENVASIQAIELLVAAQAMDFRRPRKTSPTLERLHDDYRKSVSFNNADRYMHKDIMQTIAFLSRGIPS